MNNLVLPWQPDMFKNPFVRTKTTDKIDFQPR
jgi:hypothetical protein